MLSRVVNSVPELVLACDKGLPPMAGFLQNAFMTDPFGPIQWFDWTIAQRHRGANLPHYEMPGAVYFVTFRLIDSLPAEVLAELLCKRDAFLARHPPPHTQAQERELRRAYSLPMECCLDRGLGRCILRRAETRSCLEDILRRFDADRYQLGDYVIMPNHVHMLVRLRLGLSMRTQCYDWKSISARKINRLVAGAGRLWQSEPFDHIVRSPQKLAQCRRYIQENPRNLPSSDFTLGAGKGFGQ